MFHMLAFEIISDSKQVPCNVSLCLPLQVFLFRLYYGFLYQTILCFSYFWLFTLGSWRSVCSLQYRSECWFHRKEIFQQGTYIGVLSMLQLERLFVLFRMMILYHIRCAQILLSTFPFLCIYLDLFLCKRKSSFIGRASWVLLYASRPKEVQRLLMYFF
jgi:hypothetical protein